MFACILACDRLFFDGKMDINELRILTLPDYRKTDLFYKGMSIIFGQAFWPDEDWEKQFGGDGGKSMISSLNEIVILRPSIFGFGIDINKIITIFAGKK